jgi:chromosome segregation ATPase
VVIEPDVLERLYAVEPEEFVAERKRLERSLRDDDRTEEADELAKLRKPPLPVFVANRLAREEADLVARLVEDGERLAAAHETGDPEQLRAVQGDLAGRLNALVRHAGELSDAIEQRLSTLLRAAASNPATAAQLRRGVLSEEVEPAAFDALAGMTLAAPKLRPKQERKPGPARERKRAHVEKLEGQLAEAADALREAEREFRKAEREHERAARRVAQLTERLDDAAG